MGMGSTLDTQLLKELKALHVEDLMCRPREEIVALWKDLQVPPPGAADGDWLGYIHVCGTAFIALSEFAC